MLSLVRETEFGKRLLYGGRLSVPCTYDSPLSSADTEDWRGGPPPGCAMLDAPVTTCGGEAAYLTDAFRDGGTDFTMLGFGNGTPIEPAAAVKEIRIGGGSGLADPQGFAAKRYDAEPGTTYLLRPDGYVAARFRHPTRGQIAAALARAQGLN